MAKKLTVLFVEDSEDDALLELSALRAGGYAPSWERVQTASDMRRLLQEKEWDIILCDYSMPSFDAPSAITTLKESGKDIPLIIISGTVGEDIAVEALKLGAADYLLKDNLARLIPAIERSLRETQILRQRATDEKQIREQAALLDKAQDAIFVADLEGRVLYWSKGAERMYGWTSEEAVNRLAHEFLITNPEQLREAKETLLARGDWSGELEDRTKDGRKIMVESRWNLFQGNGGSQSQSVLIINTNITEKKNLQDQVMRTQRLESIGTLTSGIAHDFNNLLTVINGHAEIGLLDLPPADKSREILQVIYDAGHRAASLTSQLLAFSRKSAMVPQVLQLNDILRELEKMLRRLIGEDIRLTVHTDPELPPIRSDPSHLEQVIMNLSVNARDAMPKGGSLFIETRLEVVENSNPVPPWNVPSGRYALLSLTDTGCGIPEHLKERIFEPFFTTKEIGKGTGLGLSTVYGIIKQNGGHILVDSEPGVGTTFKIYLPAIAGAATSHLETSVAPFLPRGTETILLVEDESAVRRLTTLILQSLGYTVLECARAEEALAHLAKDSSKVDLLITDVIMPGMNGGELVQAAEKLRPGLAVLFTSGYTSHAILEQSVLRSDTPFLQKPFSTQSLAKKVRESLGRKETQFRESQSG